MAAAVEANHDDRGIVFPRSIAPFEVVVIGVNMHNNDEVSSQAGQLYDQLMELGIDTLLDDRDEGPGAKFADADLIGIPVRAVVSPRSLKNGGIEIKHRRQPPSDSTICSPTGAVAAICETLSS